MMVHSEPPRGRIWHSTWAGGVRLRVAGPERRVKNGQENTVANNSSYGASALLAA